MTKATRIELRLDQIRIDGGTQPRAELNEAVVADYAEAISAGIQLPDGKTIFDGSDYWLYGGFHRYFGNKKAGKETMWVEVTEGTLEDARWASLAENQTHGLRRTNGDKRRAVEIALEYWPDMSDRKLAEQCGVSHPFIATIRGENKPKPRNRDGEEISTGNGFQLEDQTHTDEHEPPIEEGYQYDASDSQIEPEQPEQEKRTGLDGRTRRVHPKPPLPQPGAQRHTSKAKPREELKDKTGRVLPDSLRDVFADTGLPTLIEELEQVEAMFRAESWLSRAAKLCDHHGFILIAKFKEHVYQSLESMQLAVEALKSGVPHAVCPKCNGVDSRKENGSCCKGCRGYGFVPETRYAELSK